MGSYHKLFLNSSPPSDAYMHQWTGSTIIQVMVCRLVAPGHLLNQCGNIVDRTLRNKLQWSFARNSYILIHENPFENVVCVLAAILLLLLLGGGGGGGGGVWGELTHAWWSMYASLYSVASIQGNIFENDACKILAFHRKKPTYRLNLYCSCWCPSNATSLHVIFRTPQDTIKEITFYLHRQWFMDSRLATRGNKQRRLKKLSWQTYLTY